MDLKEELNSMGYAVILWHRDDVAYVAEEHFGKQLTEEQTDMVMHLIEKKHDCSYGVTWDTIQMHIQDLPKYDL